MKKKFCFLPLVLLPLLLTMSSPAAALAGPALTAQQEMVGISPPGWLGGALAVLSLILPVVVWFWLQRRQD